jgi:Flp pilus assembly protein TadG
MMRAGQSPPDAGTTGSMALEYGLLLPVLLLLMMGTMDVGRLIWTYTTLHRAVEASARCAAINPTACGTSSQIVSRAVSEAWGLSVTPSTFTAQTQSCGARVTANYSFPLFIPWIAGTPSEDQPNTITLTVSACYPL